MVDTGLGHRFDGLAGIGLEVEEMNHLTLSPALGWPVGGAVAVVLLACAIAQIVLHVRRRADSDETVWACVRRVLLCLTVSVMALTPSIVAPTNSRAVNATDVVVADEVSALARANKISVDDVSASDRILDIGPKSAARLGEIIANAGTIVWNGPVGVFELPQFAGGTKMLASAIAHSEAFSIAGGGDTLAAIDLFGIADKISYISTGGGAFLEFVEGKVLPAVAMLEERAKK